MRIAIIVTASLGAAILAVGTYVVTRGESVADVIPADARSGGGRGIPVILEPVRMQAERSRLEAVGTSRALRSVVLHPAATGEVTEVDFTANESVARGEVLLRLDDRDERLALQLARVRVEDAERLLSRYLRTEDSGAVSPTTIDAARTAVAEARIERDRAAVALDDRTIEAPFDGHIGITDVDVGGRIGPDTAIATLDDRSTLIVSFNVPEGFIDHLSVGSRVQVTPWSRPTASAVGRVVDLGSRIDPTNRTFVARARVANGADRLRPGMGFRVTVAIDGMPYPVVPEIAVQWGGEGPYVWALADGHARRVGVTIVQRREGSVLIDGRLDEGQRVVVEGTERMREGIAVEGVDPDSLVSENRVTAQRDGEAVAR